MTDSSSHDHDTIGEFLEQRAMLPPNDAPIFYNDLAAHFGLPPVDKFWASHPLCRIFDTLDREDAANDRPFRTALVVSRERGIPGQGFFNTLCELRHLPQNLKDEVKQRLVWTEEFYRLIAFYRPKSS